jgi:hypothetical protein
MILLVAGGIGVTPVMGMLRDIYNISPSSPTAPRPHAIATIQFLWVMPHLADYECFRSDVEDIITAAQTPGRPKLIVTIYITRAKEPLDPPLIAGRPQLSKTFEGLICSHPGKVGLVFACGPTPLVSELWDNCIERTLMGSKIDFHHEIFEF